MQSVPTVFISYGNKDKDIVVNLGEELRNNGINVLYDNLLIEDGRDWQKSLTDGLFNADCVISLLTANSISSNYVMNELGMAQALVLKSEGKKLLLPVVASNVDIPLFIRNIHVIIYKENPIEIVSRVSDTIFKFIENREVNDNDVAKQKDSEINSTLNFVKRTRKKNKINETTESNQRNYWLIKMNHQTWDIEHFKEGENTFFNTHYFGEPRPEYKMFKLVQKGDYVLGYTSGEYKCIVCQMEVTKPVGPYTAQGEGFEMIITRLINPRIPIQTLGNLIPEILSKLNKNKKPPELFFKLAENIFQSIISSETTERNLFHPYYLTEGNHQITDDQLELENDINSFASIISLKKVNPPLAIGLFGNWGSGKSFFMEKLQMRIEELSASKDNDYLEHIVPVKFNSWHYSDTNLWASLTTHIFESLNDYARKKKFGTDAINAIYKELNITALQLEATEKKIAAIDVKAMALKEQIFEKEERIKNQKEALELWKSRDFVKIVFSDPFIQKDFENIKAEFDEENLINNLNEIDKKYAEFDSNFERIGAAFSLLKENRKGKWWFIWILALFFAILGWLALDPLKDLIQKFINELVLFTGMFIIWISNLVTKLYPYFKKIDQFYKRLKSLKETVEIEKEKVKLKEHTEIDLLQSDIDRLQLEKDSIETERIETVDTRNRLQKEIEDIGSGKLLANFLEGKSTDDAYIKQLGIISWIRKDFSKLNELFQNQKAVQEKGTEIVKSVQIDRIVLYIDDLESSCIILCLRKIKFNFTGRC